MKWAHRRHQRFAHLRDRIDRSLVRGQVNVIVWLGAAALGLALFAAGVISLLHLSVGGREPSFGDAFWQSFVRTLDPGQITDDRAGFKVLGLVVTLIGLLIVSTLISLVNNRIERRVEGIRRGRDPVPPRADHVVLLGWSEIGPKVVAELAESGTEDELVDLVVLADEDVSDLRHEIQESLQLGRAGNHWPVLRSGTTFDTRDLADLALVPSARSVVVLDDGSGDGVANTVKTVMAIVAACDGPSHTRDPAEHPTIVVEVSTGRDELISRLRTRLRTFGFRLIPVDSLSLRTELAAQVSRRAGLSKVYRELLDFRGDELYITDPPAALTTFGQAVTALQDRVAVGVVDLDGEVDLWPDWSAPLAGRSLIVLACDDEAAGSDSSIELDAAPLEGERPRTCERPLERRRLLVVGWNAGAAHLLDVLDQYAGDGSSVTVVTDEPVPDRQLALDNFSEQRFLSPEMGVQAWLDHERDHFDHAIVLADDRLSPAATDAATFVTLLGLRPAGDEHGNPTTVVAQLRQRANKHLARQSLADEVVVADSVTSTVLAQLAMNPGLEPLLEELLGRTPFTVELVGNPVASDSPISFADITRALAVHGELALGWIRADGSVELTPMKDARIDADDLHQVAVLTRLQMA